VVPEDAAQDVLVVAWRKAESFEGEDVRPWLFAITRRVLAAHRRRAWMRRWFPFGKEPASASASPLRESESNQTTRTVWRILHSLPAADREVLVLMLLEERADSEVAVMMGVPKNTVKSRLSRARKRFLQEASAAGCNVPLEEP